MKTLWLLLKNQTLKEYRRSPAGFWFWIIAAIVIGAIYGALKGVSR